MLFFFFLPHHWGTTRCFIGGIFFLVQFVSNEIVRLHRRWERLSLSRRCQGKKKQKFSQCFTDLVLRRVCSSFTLLHFYLYFIFIFIVTYCILSRVRLDLTYQHHPVTDVVSKTIFSICSVKLNKKNNKKQQKDRNCIFIFDVLCLCLL